MQLFRAALELQSSYITPFHSDTLYGHLCWALAETAGPGAVADLIGACREGRPPFVISDGFPGDLLPRPLLPARRPSGLQQTRAETLMAAQQGKRLKRLELVTRAYFLAMAAGQRVIPATVRAERSALVWHNQVDRATGGAGGADGRLYAREEQFLIPEVTRTVSVYLRIEPPWVDRVRELLEHVGIGGYGKRRSVGKGAFRLASFAPDPALDSPPQGVNGFVAVSHWAPAAADPTVGAYRLTTKYGKLGGAFAQDANPFKRPLLLLRPGSAFHTGESPRHFYGRWVDGVSPIRPEVGTAAFGLAVPAVVDWHEA